MKKVLIAGGCLIAGGILVMAVLILNFGPVIKTAVNFFGPEVIHTGVGVEDVDASIFSARARLTNFFVANPDGFTSPRAMQVKSVRLDVDGSSLMSDTIVIDLIEVDSPEINYEIKGGTDNFREIMKRIKASVTSPENIPQEKTNVDKKGRNLLVRHFILKDGRVNLAVSMLQGKVVSTSLPEISLRNIGEGQGGASPEAVLTQIFDVIYGNLTSPELTAEFASQLKALGVAFDGRNIKDRIRQSRGDLEGVKSELKDMGGRIKGIFQR